MAHLLLLAFLHSTAPTGWLPPSGFAGNAIHSQRGTQPRNLDGQHLSAATTTTLLHNYTTMLVYGGRTRHIAIKLTDPRWDEALVWSRGLQTRRWGSGSGSGSGKVRGARARAAENINTIFFKRDCWTALLIKKTKTLLAFEFNSIVN